MQDAFEQATGQTIQSASDTPIELSIVFYCIDAVIWSIQATQHYLRGLRLWGTFTMYVCVCVCVCVCV
jgi:hypothetical protein